MPSNSTLMNRWLENETYGPNSGLYKAVDCLLENNIITIEQAVGLARAVRYVVSNADQRDVRLMVGEAYMPDFGELVEVSGRAQRALLDGAYLGGYEKS